VLRKLYRRLRGVDNTLSASLEGSFEQRKNLGGVLGKLVRQLFVVGDEVGDVDVAVVLLYQYIFADLISEYTALARHKRSWSSNVPVDENVVKMEVHNKVHQGPLYVGRGGILAALITGLATKKADGVCCLSVGHCGCCDVGEVEGKAGSC
jgi:hypothetical protein